MFRNNEKKTTSKGETSSGATTTCLPFDVNVMPNLYNEIPPHFIHEVKTKGYGR